MPLDHPARKKVANPTPYSVGTPWEQDRGLSYSQEKISSTTQITLKPKIKEHDMDLDVIDDPFKAFREFNMTSSVPENSGHMLLNFSLLSPSRPTTPPLYVSSQPGTPPIIPPTGKSLGVLRPFGLSEALKTVASVGDEEASASTDMDGEEEESLDSVQPIKVDNR